MSARPYIGITGIVNTDDVFTIASCVGVAAQSHRLMAGVLVSSKTLRGEATANLRYPPFGAVDTLLAQCNDLGAWPVVHFNTREDLALCLGALATALPSMRGLQLNVETWPTPDLLAHFRKMRPDVEVILQYRGATTTDALVRLAVEMSDYEGVMDFVLVDGSMGSGKALAAVDAEMSVEAIHNGDGCVFDGIGLALAGGLGPDAAPMLASLRREVGRKHMARVSLDAESGVRVPVVDPVAGEKGQDRLDRERALAWVKVAAEAVAGGA